VVSLIVVLVVSRMGDVSREEHVFRMRLHRTPESELDPQKVKLTRRIPAILIIYSLVLTAIFMIWYIRPYQVATGTDAMAEIIVLSIGPVLWISTALFARWMIRKSYG
jgi:hypothetical protein